MAKMMTGLASMPLEKRREIASTERARLLASWYGAQVDVGRGQPRRTQRRRDQQAQASAPERTG